MLNLSDLIFKIPNHVNRNECQQLIDCYQSNLNNPVPEHSLDVTSDKIVFSKVKVKTIIASDNEYSLAIDKMQSALQLWVNYLQQFKYFDINSLCRNLNYPHSVRLLKYDTGDYIHPHTDFDDHYYASVVLNLNQNYDGGEFCFFNKNLKIKLGEGDALVFPNNYFYVHEVSQITSGTRYSINSFITNIPMQKIMAIKTFHHPILFRNLPDKVFKLTVT